MNTPSQEAPTGAVAQEGPERMIGLTADRAESMAGGSFAPEVVAAALNLNQCGMTILEFYWRGER